MIPTQDPHVFIDGQGEDYVVFSAPIDGERWIIRGRCNHCGACYGELPVSPVGIDHIVRPEIAELDGCSLTGEYL